MAFGQMVECIDENGNEYKNLIHMTVPEYYTVI